MWIDNSDRNAESLLRNIHLCSDKISMKLRSTSIVAYPVNAILLSVSLRRRKWLIGSGNTLVGFPLVLYTQELFGKERSRDVEELSVYRFTSSKTVPSEIGIPPTTDSQGENDASTSRINGSSSETSEEI